MKKTEPSLATQLRQAKKHIKVLEASERVLIAQLGELNKELFQYKLDEGAFDYAHGM